MKKRFEGAMTALATPFSKGAIDEPSFRAFVRWQIDNGIDGLVPMGTTGESATMTPEERVRAVKVTVEEAKGRVPVIAGAGSNNTAETIAAVGQMRDAGADGALLVTPYYNKPSQAGLVAHYRAVAEAHPGFPLVTYNVPGRTGVDLQPETLARLADLDEVVAIKEATASMSRTIDLVQLVGDRVTLLSGDDATVLPFIACGGRGVISVSSNIVPRMMGDLVKAAVGGDLATARDLQVRLNRLHQLLFVESNPIPVKHALRVMKKFGPELRLPLTPLAEANAVKMEAELQTLGLLG